VAFGGPSKNTVLAGTVRETASHLATLFWRNHQPSPLHGEGSTHYHPMIAELFQAYKNVDPPTVKQKAITPKLLRYMYTSAGGGNVSTNDLVTFVTAELAIIGFFWAMQSCKNTTPPLPGRTKLIQLWGIVFRTDEGKIIPHTSKRLHLAARITITFEDQKNKKKMDSRTQKRTGDSILCPAIILASLVQCIYMNVPNASDNTPINTVPVTGRTYGTTQEFLRIQLRLACELGGGTDAFWI
jgi:hypothetical protein